MKIKLTAVMTALVAGFVATTDAQLTTNSGFGTIPGLPATGANPYSGSGIPYDTSQYSVVSGIPYTPPLGPDPSDTVTLALAATQHGSSNPAPGNNGAGTYTVNPGLVSGRSVWNFDFYINSAQDALDNYSFTLTEKNVGNGESFSFNPLLIPDNVGGPSSAGNSESLDFFPFGPSIGYDPTANDTYDFTLSASLNGNVIGEDAITVVDGTGAPAAAPDKTSTAGLMIASFVGLAFAAKKRKVTTS